MLKNERGSALPLALMIMFVLTLLGTALWQYFMADTIQVARAEDRLKAYYLARSGVEVGYGNLEKVLFDESTVFTSINDLSLSNVSPLNDIDTGEFDIQYQINTSNSEVIITSTGTSSNISQKEFLIKK